MERPIQQHALSDEPKDPIYLTEHSIRLGDAVYEIENIHAVKVVSQLPLRYLIYTWLSGVLWSLFLLAVSLTYVLSDGSIGERWAYVFLGLATLLTFATSLLSSVSILERASCLSQFWAFFWTTLVGTVFFYWATTFVGFPTHAFWGTLAAPLVAILIVVNLVASLAAECSSRQQIQFTLKLFGDFGVKNALTSTEERPIRQIEEQLVSRIRSSRATIQQR